MIRGLAFSVVLASAVACSGNTALENEQDRAQPVVSTSTTAGAATTAGAPAAAGAPPAPAATARPAPARRGAGRGGGGPGGGGGPRCCRCRYDRLGSVLSVLEGSIATAGNCGSQHNRERQTPDHCQIMTLIYC